MLHNEHIRIQILTDMANIIKINSFGEIPGNTTLLLRRLLKTPMPQAYAKLRNLIKAEATHSRGDP